MNLSGSDVQILQIFVRREAIEGLQPSREVVGCYEVAKMCAQLIMTVAMVALDGRLLNRAVHSFDLAVGPRVVGLS